MTVTMKSLDDGWVEFVFVEERGVLNCDSKTNDDYTEASINAIEKHLNEFLLVTPAEQFALYDVVRWLGIQPERYYIHFGWEKGDRITVVRHVGEKKLMLQFNCRIF